MSFKAEKRGTATLVKGEGENMIARLKQCGASYVGTLSLQGEK